MAAIPDESRFLAAVHDRAFRLLPAPLQPADVTASPTGREYRYADAPGFCVYVEVGKATVDVGIALDGPVGEKVYGNLIGSQALLEQTLGKGLTLKGKPGGRRIGERIPLPDRGRRVQEAVGRRLATYVLYFKPMMDDLGSRA